MVSTNETTETGEPVKEWVCDVYQQNFENMQQERAGKEKGMTTPFFLLLTTT